MAFGTAQCPHGHSLDPGVRFCRQCGASAAPSVVETVPEQARPVYSDDGSHPRRESNSVIYAIAGAVIFLGIVAIAVALVLASGSGPQNPSSVSAQANPSPASGPSASTGSTAPSSPTSTVSPGSSASAVPAGGTLCPGLTSGANPVAFGTIGSMTSCDFAGAVYQAYAAAGNAQNQPLTAVSPVTHKTYTNIVCTASGQWVTCVGGENNTARMFFATQ